MANKSNFFLKINSSREYWEQRYSMGGTSGAGSYDKLAEFKAEVINSFMKNYQINSVIEFGCGDGNQLSMFDFPSYIGLDVSRTAIKLCIERFKYDKSKSFFLYDSICYKDNQAIFKADLAISLDVLYHLVEDNIFELYMNHLFESAERYVIIYASNFNSKQTNHIKHRQFSIWIDNNLSNWKLIDIIKNKYPNESLADFFIYQNIENN